ncbi:hypothetical protein [Corallococcus macrosporus]|uniref:hypothetical protein n=1 Tax=Corallococcus macrosporus TaxID=35 RepID=UPI0003049837|nr:hypothetical protein [Corallococcus macrosporus]
MRSGVKPPTRRSASVRTASTHAVRGVLSPALMLLYSLRHVSHWLLSQRRVDLALDLYRRGLPLHLAVPRWRYMLGFPPWAVATTVRQRVTGR